MSNYAKGKASKLAAARYRMLRELVDDPDTLDQLLDAALAAQKGQPRTGNPLYTRWLGIIARCKDTRPDVWKDYGARGVVVCERWRNSFDAFCEDMGPMPTPEHTIDRKDSSGNYEPGNCRWATNVEQNRNRRSPKHAVIGVPGLSPFRGRIRVTIKAGGKLLYIGMADTVEEGTRMRKDAEALHWK